MKAKKITFSITTETLSKDCVSVLLRKVIEAVDREDYTGALTSDDGDSVAWVYYENDVTI